MFTDTITKSYTDCPRVHITDTTNMMNINFRPDFNPFAQCKGSDNFRPRQTNGIEANCLINSLVNNLTRKLHPKFTKGLPHTRLTRDQVWDLVRSECQNRNPTFVVGRSQTVVPICDARVIQGATDLTSCMINYAQELATQLELQQRKQSKPNLHPVLTVGLIAILFLFIYYILFLK